MGDTLTERVKALALDLGIDLVGVAHASSFREAPSGHRPESLLRRARSVVTMALHLPDASFELAPSREYSVSYCANLDADERNCGGCGVTCTGGETCRIGTPGS